MISTKTFYKNICAYIEKNKNDCLKWYLEDKGDNIKRYNECYKRNLYDCIFIKCISTSNIQGLFILLSSGLDILSVNCRNDILIERCVSCKDIDTCFLLQSLGCKSENYCNLQYYLGTYNLEDIEPLFRVYSPETFSMAFGSLLVSRNHTHDHVMYIFNLLVSKMMIFLKYVYVIPGEKDFIEYLLQNNHIDPTEMWKEAMFHGLRLVEMCIHGMDECMIDTLELSVKYGADVRYISAYDTTMTWEELDLRIYSDSKERISFFKTLKARRENRKIKRIYKHVLKLCRPIRRQSFLIKRIRGFSSDEKPSSIDIAFVDLPSELFSHVLSFII